MLAMPIAVDGLALKPSGVLQPIRLIHPHFEEFA